MTQEANILLEVAIASADDALVAQKGGADRLELIAALALGGLTPSLGTLIEIKATAPLPVMAMVRPRPGGFDYSPADFAVMQRDVDLLLEHGADGIVFGILHATGALDTDRCQQIIEQITRRDSDCQVVLHRAFDVLPDPIATLEQAIDVGFTRILTSGQEPTALQGAALIADLIERAGDRIEILPAGGINASTAADVIAKTDCNQLHGSLRSRRHDRSVQARPQISFGSAAPVPEDQYDATSVDAVAGLKRAISQR